MRPSFRAPERRRFLARLFLVVTSYDVEKLAAIMANDCCYSRNKAAITAAGYFRLVFAGRTLECAAAAHSLTGFLSVKSCAALARSTPWRWIQVRRGQALNRSVSQIPYCAKTRRMQSVYCRFAGAEFQQPITAESNGDWCSKLEIRCPHREFSLESTKLAKRPSLESIE
jgi:hypothetical protein